MDIMISIVYCNNIEITYIAKICFINTVIFYMVLIGSIYIMHNGIIYGNRNDTIAIISWRNVLNFVYGGIYENLCKAGELFFANIFLSVSFANSIDRLPHAFRVFNSLIVTIIISMIAFSSIILCIGIIIVMVNLIERRLYKYRTSLKTILLSESIGRGNMQRFPIIPVGLKEIIEAQGIQNPWEMANLIVLAAMFSVVLAIALAINMRAYLKDRREFRGLPLWYKLRVRCNKALSALMKNCTFRKILLNEVIENFKEKSNYPVVKLVAANILGLLYFLIGTKITYDASYVIYKIYHIQCFPYIYIASNFIVPGIYACVSKGRLKWLAAPYGNDIFIHIIIVFRLIGTSIFFLCTVSYKYMVNPGDYSVLLLGLTNYANVQGVVYLIHTLMDKRYGYGVRTTWGAKSNNGYGWAILSLALLGIVIFQSMVISDLTETYMTARSCLRGRRTWLDGMLDTFS